MIKKFFSLFNKSSLKEVNNFVFVVSNDEVTGYRISNPCLFYVKQDTVYRSFDNKVIGKVTL